MEQAPGYFYGSCCRGGNTQLAMEKQGCDQFVVEDLLDFSNEDEYSFGGGDDVGSGEAPVNSPDGSLVTAVDGSSISSGYDAHFPGDPGSRGFAGAGLSDELCAPYDELAELEWLSNFVEESFSSEDKEKLQLLSGVKSYSSSSSDDRSGVSTGQRGSGEAFAPLRPETHVPGKARSKRSRPAPTSWSSRLLVLPQAVSETEPRAAAAPASSRPGSTAKKSSPEGPAPAADGRKCLHCATDRTPQWRAGPMGPKTLCNACGVRYKSGRLVPEYRPAASPTFLDSEHSNSHRKVLELRRLKELLHGGQLPHSGGIYETPAGVVGDQFLIRHGVGRPDLYELQ